jgi:hypothetical protein
VLVPRSTEETYLRELRNLFCTGGATNSLPLNQGNRSLLVCLPERRAWHAGMCASPWKVYACAYVEGGEGVVDVSRCSTDAKGPFAKAFVFNGALVNPVTALDRALACWSRWHAHPASLFLLLRHARLEISCCLLDFSLFALFLHSRVHSEWKPRSLWSLGAQLLQSARLPAADIVAKKGHATRTALETTRDGHLGNEATRNTSIMHEQRHGCKEKRVMTARAAKRCACRKSAWGWSNGAAKHRREQRGAHGVASAKPPRCHAPPRARRCETWEEE